MDITELLKCCTQAELRNYLLTGSKESFLIFRLDRDARERKLAKYRETQRQWAEMMEKQAQRERLEARRRARKDYCDQFSGQPNDMEAWLIDRVEELNLNQGFCTKSNLLCEVPQKQEGWILLGGGAKMKEALL